MLFNSYLFIFAFLPLTLVSFYLLGRYNQAAAKITLTILSLGFYAWWKFAYLPILLFSIVFNYCIGAQIQRARRDQANSRVTTWLLLGIFVDVGLLGWFKYANFVVHNLDLFGAGIASPGIILPLAISFFTFQKIAYVVDSAQGKVDRMKFIDFALFASFFPQLIAGPIVHYAEVVPQLTGKQFSRLNWKNITVGLIIFSIGLFKKSVLADSLAAYVDPIFSAADHHQRISCIFGWQATITYTFQLYFDFSGYSDMAIGLARMLGVKLPLNFHSPLRARNIIEYWRRWHMTLQRFLVAYVFTPNALFLNRLAANLGLLGWTSFALCVLAPILATFLISGIWHGAGWTYVLWGLLHAAYIGVNEVWRERARRIARARRRAGRPIGAPGWMTIAGYHALTLFAVVVANVMFRARSVSAAVSIWSGMFTPRLDAARWIAAPMDLPLDILLMVSAFIIFALPNTQQIMARFRPAVNWSEWRNVSPALFGWQWRPSACGLIFAGITLFLGVIFVERGPAVFIYFNF